jgi:uncharacterized protein (TIGR00730 family)
VNVAVCVFCSSSDRIDQSYIQLAEAAGKQIARRGWTLVSGGGSVSSMGAVARATRAGGAHTIGVIPEVLVDTEVADHDCDELVVTADMRQRKAEMERRSDAFLALPGGIGTLEELLEIWVARTLGLHTKPVVIVDLDGVYAHLRQQIDLLVEREFMRPVARDLLLWASTAEEAFGLLEQALAGPAEPAVSPAVAAEELLEAEP